MILSERIRPNSEAAPWVVDEIIRIEQKIAKLRGAIEFLDKCRAFPDQSMTTGAMRDAHEWLESAARELCQ